MDKEIVLFRVRAKIIASSPSRTAQGSALAACESIRGNILYPKDYRRSRTERPESSNVYSGDIENDTAINMTHSCESPSESHLIKIG